MAAAARQRPARRVRSEGGGRLVAALSLTEVVSWGALHYSFGVLLVPMAAETGWSTAALSGAFSIGLLASALAAIPVGRRLDRHSARSLMTGGSVAAACLLAAWSQAESLVALYAIWAGLGVAMACVLYEPAFTVLSKELPHTRHRAIAAVTLAGALASTVFIPLTEGLTRAYGWRDAVLGLALIVAAVTIPLHLLSLPGGRGRRAGAEHPPPPAPGAGESRSLRLLATASALSALCTTALVVFLFSFLVERGLDTAGAAAAAGAMGAMQIPGRLLLLLLAGRVAARSLAPLVFALPGLGIAAGLAIPGSAGIVALVAITGMGGGMVTLLRATLVGDLFGSERYGALAGRVSAPATAAKAAAPVSAAAIAGALGGAAPLFAVLAAISALSALAATRIPRPA